MGSIVTGSTDTYLCFGCLIDVIEVDYDGDGGEYRESGWGRCPECQVIHTLYEATSHFPITPVLWDVAYRT
jgi:hypothetical protein